MPAQRPSKRPRLDQSEHKTKSLLCVARASAYQHEGDNLLEKLKWSNEQIHDTFTLANETWNNAASFQYELILVSNENIATASTPVLRKLRLDIIEYSKKGPVTIAMSQEDGLTTNVTGMVKFFEHFIAEEYWTDINIFVCKLEGEHLAFTADEYLRAYKLLQQGQKAGAHEIRGNEAALLFLAAQIEASGNKLMMSEAVQRNLKIFETSRPNRNRLINGIATEAKQPSSAPDDGSVATGGQNSRAVPGLVLMQIAHGKLQCPEHDCHEVFTSEDQWRKHMCDQIISIGACPFCPGRKISTDKVNSVQFHVRTHLENGRKIECLVCHKPFTAKQIDGHMKTKHGSREDQDFFCVGCDKPFRAVREFNKHNKDVHQGELVKCEHCSSFYKEASLRMHLKLGCPENPNRQDRKQVRCLTCSIVVLVQNFERHYRIHNRTVEIAALLELMETVDGEEEEVEEQ